MVVLMRNKTWPIWSWWYLQQTPSRVKEVIPGKKTCERKKVFVVVTRASSFALWSMIILLHQISLKKDKPGDKLGSSKTFRISRGMPEHLLLVHINLEKNINLEQKLLFSLSNLRKALKSRSWWSLSKKSPTTKDFCSRELRMAKVKVAGTGVVCLSHLRVIFHYDSISILL